ncbi:MAG: YggT family protein [Actinomycetota bacterium]
MSIIHTLLLVYIIILWARVILSFVPFVKPGWEPSSGVKPIFDLVYGLTDPPVDALRKVIPQPFNFPIDLAFLVWFFIIYIAYIYT